MILYLSSTRSINSLASFIKMEWIWGVAFSWLFILSISFSITSPLSFFPFYFSYFLFWMWTTCFFLAPLLLPLFLVCLLSFRCLNISCSFSSFSDLPLPHLHPTFPLPTHQTTTRMLLPFVFPFLPLSLDSLLLPATVSSLSNYSSFFCSFYSFLSSPAPPPRQETSIPLQLTASWISAQKFHPTFHWIILLEIPAWLSERLPLHGGALSVLGEEAEVNDKKERMRRKGSSRGRRKQMSRSRKEDNGEYWLL